MSNRSDLSGQIDWEYKVVRDPLYGFIGLTQKEVSIAGSWLMQRLTRIKQLSHTFIVYPSAVHTRFEHSLGTLHVADRICKTLNLEDQKREIIRYAALVHDISHGPFSHLFEIPLRKINGIDFSYENLTKLLLRHDREVSEILSDSLNDVISVLEASKDRLMAEIISGALDADKMDYLRRDSYHTGVAYGVFDLERIIRNLRVTEDSNHLVLSEKAQEAIESYRLGRYLLHAQVYEHHARLIADDMFLRAVKLALDEGVINRDLLKIGNKAERIEEFIEYYKMLDDTSIYQLILKESKGNAKKLIENLMWRRLLKRGYEVWIAKDEIPDALKRDSLTRLTEKEMCDMERNIANEAGVDPDFVIMHPQSIAIRLYEPFEQTMGKRELPILIRRPSGLTVPLDEVSPISAAQAPIRRLYVFCPKEAVDSVKHSVEKHLRVPSRR